MGKFSKSTFNEARSQYDLDDPIKNSETGSEMTDSRKDLLGLPKSGDPRSTFNATKTALLAIPGSTEDLREAMVKSSYYDSGESNGERPGFLRAGLVEFDGKFALAVFLEEANCLQFCEPYSLQPFLALSLSPQKVFLLEHLDITANVLVGYNHRQLVAIELDNDGKDETNSCFFVKQDLHDPLRFSLLKQN